MAETEHAGVTLTLDTSGVVALANRKDRNHARAVNALSREAGPAVVPAGILAEAAYMLEARLGIDSLDAFISDLEEGRLLLDCGESDLGRIREQVSRYADLPLGFTDAAVLACAERRGGKVLTFDRRDFEVVAREGTVSLVP